jgi:PAS domain S-box-containing protein
MNIKIKKRKGIMESMILVAIIISIGYWILDSIFNIFFSNEFNFFGELIGPDLYNIYIRVTVLCLFIIFGSHAQSSINKLRETRDLLREGEERLKTILNSVQTGVVIIEPETHIIVDANPAATKIIGTTKEQIVGKECLHYICPEEKGQCPIADRGLSLNNEERTLLTTSGECVPILKSVVPVTLSGREHLLESFLDITGIKEAEKQREAKIQAETSNRAKSQFLASMSHEIRTPMTAVIGMADLLWESPLTGEQRRFVEAIRSSGENLLQVINDILDLSKVEAGQIELEKTPFDLIKVINNICETQTFQASIKNIELVKWIKPEVETLLLGDSVRLGQILTNLIGNAIKFTEEGEVFVKVERHEVLEHKTAEDMDSGLQPETGKTTELLFSVTDTGIGIPEEKWEAIFDRFTQADSSTTRQFGGTGLGLSISHRLVELMGGRMWLESKVGQGSTFFFTTRFDIQSDKEYIQIPEVDIKGLKVLIIDDNATNRMVLSEMVSRWGALATEKEDGERGLAEMRRAKDAGESYDLVLLDCMMPGMDGFEVTASIKEDSTFSNPVIMMLTSNGRKEEMQKRKELGITDYLVKPIKWSDLKDAVMVALGRKEATDRDRLRVTEPVVQADLSPLNILLVDDNENNRMLIQAFLKKTPYTIDTSENGEKAVEKFKSDQYNLVLMDIEMPVMDGYTATGKIREWEAENQQKATPIIALTAHALKEHIQKSLDAGCNAHLTKPIKKADLLAAIEKYAI